MRLLVTGGAGFIGSNLVHSLLPKTEVEKLVVLDSLTYAGHQLNLEGAQEFSKYSFSKIDIRERESVNKLIIAEEITHVIHLAAESHVDRSISDPGAFIETNVLGTFNLLEACRVLWKDNYSKCRFVHVSTDEVFGSLGKTGFFSESSPYQPNSPYSASKAGADHLVCAYNHTYDFPGIITNCSNNFGPFQFPEKLIPQTIHLAASGQPIPVYGDGTNVRDWLYVRDHVEALWLGLTSGESGESYNIGADNEWPNLRLIEKICDLVDRKLNRQVGAARELVTFVKDRQGHDFRYAIDASKIRQELGWEPAHKFESAIEITVNWYLSNGDWLKAVMS